MADEHPIDKDTVEKQITKFFPPWYIVQKEGNPVCDISDLRGEVLGGLPYQVAEELWLAREKFIQELCVVFQRHPEAFKAWRIRQEPPNSTSG